jgi:hypothetical protein
MIGCATRHALGAVLLLTAQAVAAPGEKIEFNRDVRPILSDKCFRCHGPDASARKAELRLDQRENALAAHDSGRAIVPGKPGDSEVMHRILTEDEDDRMPPKKSNLELSKAEAEILRRWIEQGAEYQAHWSLVPPREHKAEGGGRKAEWKDWPRNAIDDFVLDRLLSEKLAPAPEADAATLVRRVSLALTGLPPTLEEVEAFSHSALGPRPSAFEALVDRLLASPRFGERMAVDWLDAARYADTNGYFRDTMRQAWP